MIISICNEKGGSGKSTIATNLAIFKGLNENELPILIDTDPQQSIGTFTRIRNHNQSNTKAFDYMYLGNRIELLQELLQDSKEKKETSRDLIIDTGGRDSREMRVAIAYSDIVIIPTIPSQFDASVLDKMAEIIKMAKEVNADLKAFIVINRASPNPFLSKKIESLKSFIKELENDYIKLTDTIIYEREAYKIATSLGLGVCEMKENKAKVEIQNLCKEIL